MSDVILVVVLLVAAASARWLLWDLRVLARRPAHVDDAVSVSVVVPARNEQSTLPTLLESLRQLEVAVRDVVVVDDGSEDATAAVARSAGAVVLQAGPPPAGWTGKASACDVGARASTGDLLLFLDADTALAPHALRDLVDVQARHGGLVSVQPFHCVVRPYEQLSAYFNVVSLMASGAFGRRRGKRPMAFGPCLLTSRGDYERSGGHAAVRGEILDDVSLAVAYDKAGLPVRCAAGGQSIRMRSYPGGIRQLAGGWTKNFASGAAAAALGPALGSVLWVCSQHVVAVAAILPLVAVATGRSAQPAHWHLALVAFAWLVVAWQLRSILRRIGSFRWWTWLLFPVPLLAFDVLFAISAVLTVFRRSVRWRGREVPLHGRGSAGEGA